VIIPDLKKEYRHLLPIAKQLKVLTRNYIKINLLEPPHWMALTDYIILFSKIFVGENWLGGTSEISLNLTLEALYKAMGVFDGGQNYPTIRDLYDSITRQLEAQKSFKYRDILLWLQNRLFPYKQCEAFDCRRGLPHDIWQKENLVLELDTGFTDNMYSFLVSYIAGLRYTYNKANDLTGSKLRTLFSVDEARVLLSASRDVSVFGESYFNQIITKCREFGLGLILLSQESASFNQTIRSISFLKMAFPLNDAKDVDFIRESFGLNEEQAAFLFRLPPYGQAIVRYGGYEKPFLLAVPHFRIKRQLTDEEVEERMAGFYSELELKIAPVASPTPIRIIEVVPPYAAALLYFLGKEPFTKKSQMTDAAGFKSPAEVDRAFNWLIEHGFVEKEECKFSRRGPKSIFAGLTEKAYTYLSVRGPKGKGDFEHKLYQHLICEKLREQGFKANVEGRIEGSDKSIDVLAYDKEQGYAAYEVTLHFENLLSNIRQDLEAGASQVVIVTKDKPGLSKAEEMVESEQSLNQHLERIFFLTIDHFFD
jgi:hypothetical protein